MELTKNVGGRNRLARTILAVGLAIVAIASLRKGKRLSGALAGVGALALGYDATTGGSELTETLGIGTTSEDVELRCASCGQPIRPGERRGPNENNEIVHESCMASVE
jgi:hypothetical protein